MVWNTGWLILRVALLRNRTTDTTLLQSLHLCIVSLQDTIIGARTLLSKWKYLVTNMKARMHTMDLLEMGEHGTLQDIVSSLLVDQYVNKYAYKLFSPTF